MADSLIVHQDCFIVRDSNGYKCLPHNCWVYRYCWKSNKAENFKSHYWKVAAFLGVICNA